jgi:hypothetical protein
MTQSLRLPMIVPRVNHLLEYGCATDRDCRICLFATSARRYYFKEGGDATA